MRKYVRKLMRNRAEKIGVKQSRYVHSEFNRKQSDKYGDKKRLINQAKGTHKRKTWRTRIILAV